MDKSIIVGKRQYNFKDDYFMYEQEKVEDAVRQMKEGKISDLEVSYTSIFYLLDSVVDVDTKAPIDLNYNQIREDFRNMKSKEFKSIATLFAYIMGDEEDKKK